MTEPDHSLARKLKDTAAGFAGGAVQVLVGQPFDLVKVRLQTTTEFGQTPYQVFKNTLTKEGPLAFYKGTLAPLLGVGACVSLQFYAFHEAKRQLISYYQSDMTLPRFYVAGAVAGIANTVITSPVEQVRILLQATNEYHGPRDAVKKIYNSKGLAGLYRGGLLTTAREAQAYGVWFFTYEYLMMRETRHTKREDIPTWKLMAFGALAGEALWISSYPLDVIKSQVQSDSFSNPRYPRGARDAILHTYNAYGFAGFWKGIAPTLLRAIPASSCTFATVELTLRLLG